MEKNMKKNDNDLLLKQLTDELINEHKCHTVILYGSRARGDFTEQSDYDLMGVKKTGKKYRVAEKRNGFYLDIFIYPENELRKVGEEYFYMEGAKVLYEKEKFGTTFLKKLKTATRKKYKPLPPDEIQVRRIWLHKMFDRIAQGDIEGNYRRSWLQEALLYEYFNIRKERYWGSKKSFDWLKANDPKIYRLFEQVLKHPLKLHLLKKLVEQVSELKVKN